MIHSRKRSNAISHPEYHNYEEIAEQLQKKFNIKWNEWENPSYKSQILHKYHEDERRRIIKEKGKKVAKKAVAGVVTMGVTAGVVAIFALPIVSVPVAVVAGFGVAGVIGLTSLKVTDTAVKGVNAGLGIAGKVGGKVIEKGKNEWQKKHKVEREVAWLKKRPGMKDIRGIGQKLADEQYKLKIAANDFEKSLNNDDDGKKIAALIGLIHYINKVEVNSKITIAALSDLNTYLNQEKEKIKTKVNSQELYAKIFT